MTWRDIGSAPKDGTTILGSLVYASDGEHAGILTVRWEDSWQQWVMAGCLIGFEKTGDPDDDMRVTAWQPLPLPPA